jgi:hypothetical protein
VHPTERGNPRAKVVAVVRSLRLRSPCPRRKTPKACSPTHLKEFVMNETLELEIVELGEAKELTKGPTGFS